MVCGAVDYLGMERALTSWEDKMEDQIDQFELDSV